MSKQNRYLHVIDNPDVGLSANGTRMDFNEFVKTDEPGCLYLDEGFALWEIDGGKWDGKPLLLEKTHSILFIVSGELQTKIDGKAYVFSRNGFADIIDAIPLEVVSLSEDLHAYHMLLTYGNFVYIRNQLKY